MERTGSVDMKKKIVIISSIFVLFVISASAFLFAVDKKPFEDLQASEVASASVLLLPPNESIEIDNIDTLVGMLNNIELSSRTIGHKVSGGQSCVFTITKTDGNTQEINVFGSYVIIDGVGYKGTYLPCEELNQYANSLLE